MICLISFDSCMEEVFRIFCKVEDLNIYINMSVCGRNKIKRRDDFFKVEFIK